MYHLRILVVLADFDRREGGNLVGAIVAGIALFAALGILVYLLRYLQRCRGISERAMNQMDEQSKAIARSCEHMEIAERHMAAVERKLDDVIDQLKRRPLS